MIEIVLGIDPGLSGGLAIVGEGGPCAIPMPTSKRRIDWQALVRVIHRVEPPVAAIEKVWSIPGFAGGNTFAVSYGTYLGILHALHVPVVEIPPREWQAAYLPRPSTARRTRTKGESDQDRVNRMGHGKAARKAALVRIAESIWPGLQFTSGTADAMLIAEYYRRKLARERIGA